MKILHRNATAILFEKVSTMGNYHNSWRAIHLKLAGKLERYNQMLRTYFIIKGVANAVSGNDGYIYLCSDGDIFILFQGSVKPIMGKLAEYFGDIELEYGYSEKNGDKLYTIYDLSRDWSVFSNLCFAKLVDEENWPNKADYSFYKDAEKVFSEASQD